MAGKDIGALTSLADGTMAKNSEGQTGLPSIGTELVQLPDSYEDYLPLGCPPDSAQKIQKVVYRLVRNDPPTAHDFRTAHELNNHKDKDPCQRCSLSVSGSLDASKELRRFVPAFKDRKISSGVITPLVGVIMDTSEKVQDDHWSWWPRKGLPRHTYFAVIP